MIPIEGLEGTKRSDRIICDPKVYFGLYSLIFVLEDWTGSAIRLSSILLPILTFIFMFLFLHNFAEYPPLRPKGEDSIVLIAVWLPLIVTGFKSSIGED